MELDEAHKRRVGGKRDDDPIAFARELLHQQRDRREHPLGNGELILCYHHLMPRFGKGAKDLFLIGSYRIAEDSVLGKRFCLFMHLRRNSKVHVGNPKWLSLGVVTNIGNR